jgi:hypothetical protein
MARAILALLLVGCGVEKGVTAFNSTPEATITSHQTGDVSLEGEWIVLRGAGSDANHSADELTATWFLEGLELCASAPPGEDGSTVCEFQASPDKTQIHLEIKDPQNATGAAAISLSIVPTEAPSAEITEPDGNGLHYQDHPIGLEGSVWDAEDGPENLAATWTSDIDGTLVEAQPPGSDGQTRGEVLLSEGSHTISLVAEDSLGKTGMDSVTVEVGPPNQAPTCQFDEPADGGIGLEGETLEMLGQASDPDIPAEMLAVDWYSDLDGLLGSSPPDGTGIAALSHSGLSVGTHVLAMTATDEIGANCTAETMFTVGNPPAVEILSPVDGSMANEGESALFTANVSDDSDPSETLSLLWASNLQGILSTQNAAASGESAFEAPLAAGTHNITLVATDSLGYETSDSVQFTVNGLPSAPEVLLSPSPSAYTSEDLLVSASGSLDPEGDLVAYTYLWFRDGTPTANTSSTLPASETAKGEIWTVQATPDDGNGQGPSAEAETEIVNTPPSIASISISPSQTYNDGTLTCTATSSDPDEAASISYLWTVDGLAAGTSGSLDLSLTDASPGSEATCEATAMDGEGATDTGSASITVSNRAPIVLVTAPASGQSENEGTELAFTGTAYDPDGDGALSITWTSSLDGELSSETITTAGGSQTAVELSIGSHTITLSAADSMGLSGSDTITVVVNGLPSAPLLSLEPSPEAATTEDLVASASGSSDPEGSPVSYSYSWLRDGVATAHTGATLPSAETQSGETWTVLAYPSDGTGTGEPAEASTEIVNSAPSILAVEIDPDPAYIGDTLECLATAADPDESPTVSYEWLLDGAPAGSAATLALAAPAGPGAVATCTATATDSEGETGTADASLTVSNRPPTVDLIEVDPDPATISSEITCFASASDPDGDAPSIAYEWHGSSGLLAAASTVQLDGGMVSPGETLTCYVLVTDGSGATASGSESLEILSNIPPTLVDESYSLRGGCILTIAAQEGLLANDSDPDGDELSVSLLQGPASGDLSLEDDGSFTYQPYGTGDDSFTYEVSDGNGGTSEGTATLAGIAGAITVDTEEDSLATDGLCSLREAVQSANSETAVDGCEAGSGADTIVFAEQDMEILFSMEGPGEDSGLSGDLDIFSELSILGCPSSDSGDSEPDTVLNAGATISWQENCDDDYDGYTSWADCDDTDPLVWEECTEEDGSGDSGNPYEYGGNCVTIPLTIYSGTLAEFDRHIEVHSGAVLYLEDIHLRGGGVKGEYGSALYNAGEAYLEDSWFTDNGNKGLSGTRGKYGSGSTNTGQGGGGGGGGGAGFGGAVYNAPGALLELSQDDGSCLLSGNAAIGGSGANGGHHGNGGSGMTSASSTYGGDGGGAEGGIGTAGSSCNAAAGGFGGGGAGGQLLCIGGTGGFGGGGGGGGARNGGGSAGGPPGPGGFGGGDGGQEACSASAGGGAGAGMGGAVFNDQGTLSVYGCHFEGNAAIGGKRGGNYFGCSSQPAYGGGIGGAVFSYMGEAELDGCTFTGNEALGGRSDNAVTASGEGYGGALFSYQGTMAEDGNVHSGNTADTNGDDYAEEP